MSEITRTELDRAAISLPSEIDALRERIQVEGHDAGDRDFIRSGEREAAALCERLELVRTAIARLNGDPAVVIKHTDLIPQRRWL